MPTYYNDNDLDAAVWLGNLVQAGLVPLGRVDGRDIADVQPADLGGYRHVHLFAGIGGWAYAAKLSGWPQGRELWTASCPCQPWSIAGRRRGVQDSRDLWHHVVRLVSACRPAVIVGEQVASTPGYAWFDRASADLAQQNYAVRAVDIPALAVNSPQQRQRLYWAALAQPVRAGLERSRTAGRAAEEASDQFVDANPDGLGRFPWSDTVDVVCADGRQRRAKPGVCWMVDGIPPGLVELRAAEEAGVARSHTVRRAALWKGYGNAVVPQVAAAVLGALLRPM